MPISMLNAAIEGATEALNIGTRGYPLTGINVTILEMRYIDGESDTIAYKIASSIAVREAIRRANPVLLEPIFRLDISSPPESVGDIISDINSRKGRVESVDTKGNMQSIMCLAPLSELFGYVTKLRSLSQGRASYSMNFYNYEPSFNKL